MPCCGHVFLDDRTLEDTCNLPKELDEAILQSDIMVCLVSSNYLGKLESRGWIPSEVKMGHGYNLDLQPIGVDSFKRGEAYKKPVFEFTMGEKLTATNISTEEMNRENEILSS